ncbi:MAG: hypothetical protein KGL12_05250 [Rhodospirillales bacterium]|nr:hypothetical protein [Rhodospirillales bacterium]
MSPSCAIALAPLDLAGLGPDEACAAIAAVHAAAARRGAALLILAAGALPPGEALQGQLAALSAPPGPDLLLGAADRVLLFEGGALRASREVGAASATMPGPIAWRNRRLGVLAGAAGEGPDAAETLAETGAECLIWLHRIPFAPDAAERRLQTALARVVETRLPLLALGPYGLESEAVFDGDAFALDHDRRLIFRANGEAALSLLSWREAGWTATAPLPAEPLAEAALWAALRLGLARAVARGRYPGIVLALDAGLADLLLALLAIVALGTARVRALVRDGAGQAQAAALGIAAHAIDPAPAAAALGDVLRAPLNGRWGEAQAEPLAGRLDALLLVSLAEAFGDLALSPADAAALARGAATAGCFAPFKTLSPASLARLAAWQAEAAPGPLADALLTARLPSPAAPRPGQRRAAPLWPAPPGLALVPAAPTGFFP